MSIPDDIKGAGYQGASREAEGRFGCGEGGALGIIGGSAASFLTLGGQPLTLSGENLTLG